MNFRTILLTTLFTCSACAPRSQINRTFESTSQLIDLQRRWWSALSNADTAFLRAESDPALYVTLSSGGSFGIDSLIHTFAVNRHTLEIKWSNEVVRWDGGETAVLTAECEEREGPRFSNYRYLTVLKKSDERWRVVAAQSTRKPVFTARVKETGSLAYFEGSYRTPRGLFLKISADSTSLILQEPSGLSLRLEPIGTGVFESDYVSPDGSITRYLFNRNDRGLVTSLSVLSPGMISTFPRDK